MCLFDRFNFSVADGQFVSVVGSNGSGKTSMLNIICGSIPVEEGQIFLYCKKLNVAPNAWDTSDSFRETWWYFPMPENETIF